MMGDISSVSAGSARSLSSALRPAQMLVNPSFSVSIIEAREDLRRMAADARPLERPLLVISGFLDPGASAWYLWWRLGRLIRRGPSDPFYIVRVSLFECLSLDQCRRKILRAVARSTPDGSAESPVDAIGVSLGGMAARYSALPRDDGTSSLQLRQLFTISSPLTGADDADRFPPLHPMQRELRRGSAMYGRVNGCAINYKLHPYTRLRDKPVGVNHAAPTDCVPWWVDTPRWRAAHNGAPRDPRILADVIRRLRHEAPLTTDPAAPLPGS